MTIHVNLIEGFWIAVNLLTFVVTVSAWLEARRDVIATRVLNGDTRGIVARGTARRERIRLITQVAFLAIAVPAVFSDRDTAISLPLVIFLTIPVLVLTNTLSDRRDRLAIARKSEYDIHAERETGIRRLEARADRLQAVSDDTNAKVTELTDRSPSDAT